MSRTGKKGDRSANPRTAKLEVRLTDEERAIFDAWSDALRIELSTLVRERLLPIAIAETPKRRG